MSEDKKFAKDYLIFRQGQESLFGENDSVADGIEKIRSKLSDLTNIKNLHFLLGAGASSDAIPAMAPLIGKVTEKVEATQTMTQLAFLPENPSHDELKKRFKSAKDVSPKNLENILGTLYSKREYLKGVGQSDSLNDFLINLIETEIYSSINIDCTSAQAELSLDLYKKLYQKLALRNKDLARVNVFTTNNDLLSETALGFLNINLRQKCSRKRCLGQDGTVRRNMGWKS